ncbi:hypothetical protein PL9214510104 [Planktothrix tepida PCC 9214]|uniref:Uncharacterized protein n=1 Tax=Planktothrix tepida PCC 9214 TaxID=671072 RepID=A0A1J1LLU4_9CYAN|nr:hypothetical protein PL9214510104 [Planktothrix tepida PCC 9214]
MGTSPVLIGRLFYVRLFGLEVPRQMMILEFKAQGKTTQYAAVESMNEESPRL